MVCSPSFDIPAPDPQQQAKKMAIVCHTCGQAGHKAAQCLLNPAQVSQIATTPAVAGTQLPHRQVSDGVFCVCMSCYCCFLVAKHPSNLQGWESSGFCQNSGFLMVLRVILQIRLNLGRKYLYIYVHYNRRLLTPCTPAIMSAILSRFSLS